LGQNPPKEKAQRPRSKFEEDQLSLRGRLPQVPTKVEALEVDPQG